MARPYKHTCLYCREAFNENPMVQKTRDKYNDDLAAVFCGKYCYIEYMKEDLPKPKLLAC